MEEIQLFRVGCRSQLCPATRRRQGLGDVRATVLARLDGGEAAVAAGAVETGMTPCVKQVWAATIPVGGGRGEDSAGA